MNTRLFERYKLNYHLGFTLIELLVVIAIIGLLASIVLASLNSARRKSRDARRITDIKQLQLAMELYFDGVGAGSYPVGSGLTQATFITVLTPLVTNNYIPVLPTDPSGGTRTYFYDALTTAAAVPTSCITAPCTYYHLGADLEEDATTGDTGGNPALVSDKDLFKTVGVAPGTDFEGYTIACTGAESTTVDGCYDVTP